MPRVLPLVKTVAFRRGVAGAGKVWFGIWIGSEAIERLRKLFTPEPEVVEAIRLRPGQGLEIQDLGIGRGELAGREKAAARAAKRLEKVEEAERARIARAKRQARRRARRAP